MTRPRPASWPNVEYRRVQTKEERLQVYRLRYDAYLHVGAIEPNASGVLYDAWDETDNSATYMVFVESRLAGSIRLHWIADGRDGSPALEVFRDELQPYVSSGKRVLDPNRFVSDHRLSKQYPMLPNFILRIPFMAMEHYGASFLTATVRTEHEQFYRRVLGYKQIAPPRLYPTLTKPLGLMVADYGQLRDRVLKRHGGFASTPADREAIFSRRPS
jgi:hypothetical protein